MSQSLQLADGTRLMMDEQGYLTEWQLWTREVAEILARDDGLDLGEEHWQILKILRQYYDEFEIAPPMRALVKILRLRSGNDDLGSRELYRLFPEGPAKQACRYAGLPRPVSCI